MARAAGSAEGGLEVSEVRLLLALLVGGGRLALVRALLLAEAVAPEVEAVRADPGGRDEVGGGDVADLDASAGGGPLADEVEFLLRDAVGSGDVEVDVELGEAAPKVGLGLVRGGGMAVGLQVASYARERAVWAPGRI